MSKNNIINNGNGISTIIVESKKHGQMSFIIDTQYVSLIEHHSWSVSKIRNHYYCVTSMLQANGKYKSTYLHAVINGTPPGMVTDHISGNTHDNRKANLRTVTIQQNQFNQKNARGYSLMKNGKFRASITLNAKYIHLGYFDTEQEARDAYLEAKKVLHII